MIAISFGAVACFVWFPASIWGRLLPSTPSKLFPVVFASAFVAGWVVGLRRLKTTQTEFEGAIRSHASITGILAALVAVYAAHAASGGPKGASLPFMVAASFFALGLLPCALFATVGAGFAVRAKERRGKVALVAIAIIPVVAVLVWPVVYGIGKFLEKPPTAIVIAPVTPVALELPKPRYVKPEVFDSANAWKRTVIKDDVVSDLASGSPLVLSHSEKQIALVSSANGKLFLTVRHLYEPDQDRSIVLPGGVVALAWSADDSRHVLLGGDGAFAVCEVKRAALFSLPIPKVDPLDVAGLVWWQPEDVLLISRRGEPQVLSLDTLRLMPASQHQGWAALKDEERQRIVRTAVMPPLHSGDKLRYSVEGNSDDRSLMAHAAEAIYSRILAANLSAARQAFSNRDGSIVFLAERERLRILYIGIRDAPPLRFVAESREGFPVTDTTKAAIKDRAIECVIAPPIINPLNGKTVSGDVTRAKGLARVIAADGRTATVWVSEERAPIREGDVVMLPRAPLPKGDALLSPTWFAVLAKADASQDIPRRQGETPSVGPKSETSAAPPSPATPPAIPAQPPAPVPKTDAPSSRPVYDELMKHRSEWMPKKAEPPATRVSQIPPLPGSASAKDRVKHFIETHHAKISDRNIDGFVADYGAIVNLGGKDVSRDAIRREEQSTLASVASLVETVDGPIAVTAQQNSRYHAEYGIAFEMTNRDGSGGQGSALVDMDVLLTSTGPKIVSKKTRVYKKGPVQKR